MEAYVCVGSARSKQKQGPVPHVWVMTIHNKDVGPPWNDADDEVVLDGMVVLCHLAAA